MFGWFDNKREENLRLLSKVKFVVYMKRQKNFSKTFFFLVLCTIQFSTNHLENSAYSGETSRSQIPTSFVEVMSFLRCKTQGG